MAIKNKYQVDDQSFFDLKRSKNYEMMSYDEQINIKQATVERLFYPHKVETIIKNPVPKGYRHKAVLSAVNEKIADKKYKIRLGLYEEGTKKIIPNLNHFVHYPQINEIFKTIEAIFHQFKIKAYHPNDRSGLIKHVLIRKSYAYDEVMVVFVTMGYILPNHKDMIKALVAKHPEIKTVIQNMHDKETSIVLLDKEKVLYGTGYIKDQIDQIDFRISAKAFYQVNPEQMLNLYHVALKFAQISKNEVVMDCYSGIGTISLLASLKAKEVIGVEINKTAVEDALYNKRINQISNVMFYANDVEEFMQNYQKPIDVLIMDPTRDGSTPEFLEALKRLKPKKVVYISCDPYTQIRDLRLIDDTYEIKKIQPVDMFSYTSHVETIALLALK